MSKEAMKRTVDKIKSTFWEGYLPEPVKPARCKYPKCSYPCSDLPDCRDAEQPAQQALDKKAENARELGLDYEPAQPVVWHDAPQTIYLQVCPEADHCEVPFADHDEVTWCQDKIHDSDIAYVRASTTQQPPAQQEPVAYIHRQGNHYEVSERFLSDDEKSRGWTEEPLYASPPAQRTWVGLTDEERKLVRNSVGYNQFVTAGEYAEHVQKATEFKLLEKNNG